MSLQNRDNTQVHCNSVWVFFVFSVELLFSVFRRHDRLSAETADNIGEALFQQVALFAGDHLALKVQALDSIGDQTSLTVDVFKSICFITEWCVFSTERFFFVFFAPPLFTPARFARSRVMLLCPLPPRATLGDCANRYHAPPRINCCDGISGTDHHLVSMRWVPFLAPRSPEPKAPFLLFLGAQGSSAAVKGDPYLWEKDCCVHVPTSRVLRKNLVHFPSRRWSEIPKVFSHLAIVKILLLSLMSSSLAATSKIPDHSNQ